MGREHVATPGEIGHFWSRLSRILGEGLAPGALQSHARFLSGYTSRRAAIRLRSRFPGLEVDPRRWREALILVPYGAVGYGERIARPLIIGFLVSVIIAVSLDDLRNPGVWESALRMFFSPLTLLRMDIRPVSGIGAVLIVALGRAVGVLLWALALLAVRRLVRWR